MTLLSIFQKYIYSSIAVTIIFGYFGYLLLGSASLLIILIGSLSAIGYLFYRAYDSVANNSTFAPTSKAISDQSEIGIESFISAQPFPTLIVDQSDMILYINQAMDTVFSDGRKVTQQNKYIGQHYAALIRKPQIISGFVHVKNTKEAVEFNFDPTNIDDTHYWLNISPIQQIDGDYYYCFTFRDLTKDQKLEQMRADFVANASHELRTPLASISGFIETLQNSAKDDQQVRSKFLGIMQDQASRMTRLIDDLLSLSKIEMNIHTKPQDLVDLKEILEHCVKSLAPIVNDKNIQLNFIADIDQANIKGDRDQLIQLINNLLDNAFKYGIRKKDNQHQVDLKLSHKGSHFHVAIIDYGHGILAQDLPRLTERFYRISNDHKSIGTGLGLAIVKHIVQRHGAVLNFNSQLGKGTQVELIFNMTC